MDDIKRQDQIQKIESLIKKQKVSRRDFFGSLGKIAILSQVVALGAFNFLSSCVAFEDKNDASGKLKSGCPTPNQFDCNNFQCVGDFTCEIVVFSCGPVGSQFMCNPINDEFQCLDVFRCNNSFSHSGGSGG
jgi:hypothetical protein